MNSNILLTEKLAVLATLDPASVAASTVVTAWVPVAAFHSIMALVQTGVLGTSATVDAKLRQATSSAGAGAKDITGKAITQLVVTTNNNNQALIECRGDDLDSANGFAYVALSVTVGVAASIVSAALLGGNPLSAPCSGSNQAAVVQVIG